MHITLKRGEIMANSCSIDVLVKLFPKIPTCITVRTDGCHRFGGTLVCALDFRARSYKVYSFS